MSCSGAIVIGLGGVTGGGKSTLAKMLEKYYSEQSEKSLKCHIIDEDLYYWPEDHDFWKKPGGPYWDTPQSIDFKKLVSDLTADCKQYDLVIVEGVMIFDDSDLNSMINKKFYFTLDYEECKHRRENRPPYDPPDEPGNFDRLCWPAYLDQLERMKSQTDLEYFDASKSIEELFKIFKQKVDSFLSTTKLCKS